MTGRCSAQDVFIIKVARSRLLVMDCQATVHDQAGSGPDPSRVSGRLNANQAALPPSLAARPSYSCSKVHPAGGLPKAVERDLCLRYLALSLDFLCGRTLRCSHKCNYKRVYEIH
jgi:hypothetical protein